MSKSKHMIVFVSYKFSYVSDYQKSGKDIYLNISWLELFGYLLEGFLNIWKTHILDTRSIYDH